MVEAELAVVTLLRDPFQIAGPQPAQVALMNIDAIKERVEGRAYIKAAPASVTDLIDAEGFSLHRGPGYGRCHQIKPLHARFLEYSANDLLTSISLRISLASGCPALW